LYCIVLGAVGIGAGAGAVVVAVAVATGAADLHAYVEVDYYANYPLE